MKLQGFEVVLDAGRGNGALSRRMAKKGAEVFGVDFSSALIKQARQRGQDVQYEEMDLTDRTQLQHLAKSNTFKMA